MHGEQPKPWSAELVDSIFSGKISPVVTDQFDALLRWLGGRTTPDALAIDSELKRRDVDIEEAARLALVLLEKLLFENRDNPYTVLGLSLSASEEKVEKRYKRLVSIFHPDRQYADAEWLHRCTERLNTAYDRIRRGDTGSVSARSSGVRANGSKSRSAGTSGTSGYTYGESESDVERVVRSTLGSARSFQIKVFSGLVLVAAIVVGYLYLLDSTNPEQVYLPEVPDTAVDNADTLSTSPVEAASQSSDREIGIATDDQDASDVPQVIAEPGTYTDRDGASGERLATSDDSVMAAASGSTTRLENSATDHTVKTGEKTLEEARDTDVDRDLTNAIEEFVSEPVIENAEIDTHVETTLVLPMPEPEATRDANTTLSTAPLKPEIAEPAAPETAMVAPEESNDPPREEATASSQSPMPSSGATTVVENETADTSKSVVPSTAVVAKATPVQRKLNEADVINMVNRTLSRFATGLERSDVAVLSNVLMPVVKVDDKTVQRSTLVDEQKALSNQAVWRRVNHKVAVTIGSTSANPRARGVMEEKLRFKDGKVEEIVRQFEFGFDVEGDRAVISSMAFWNEQRETTVQAAAAPVESTSPDNGLGLIDSAAVESFLSSYVDAYGRGDAYTFARHFTPDAAHQRLSGRDAIESYYQRFFNTTAWRQIALSNMVMQPSRDNVKRVLADFVVTGKETNDKALYLAGRLELDLGLTGEQLAIERLTWREAPRSTQQVTESPIKVQEASVGEKPEVPVPESKSTSELEVPTGEIEAFLSAYQSAYNAEDMARFSEKFAVDARQKRLKGRDAVAGFYRDFFSTTRWHRLEFDAPRVKQTGDNLFEVKVRYTVTGEDVSGASLNLTGRLGLDLKRSGSGFEIARLDY